MGKVAKSSLWKQPYFTGVFRIPRKTEYRIRNAKNKRSKNLVFEPDPNVQNHEPLDVLNKPSTSTIGVNNHLKHMTLRASSTISSDSLVDSTQDIIRSTNSSIYDCESGSEKTSDHSIPFDGQPQFNDIGPETNYCDVRNSDPTESNDGDRISESGSEGVDEKQDHEDTLVKAEPHIFQLYYDEELYAGSSITLRQSLLLTMAHIIRFQESKEATASLLKLLSFHMPSDTELPQTLYRFYKNFDHSKSLFTFHMYCAKCCAYIGKTSKCCQFCQCLVSYERALENGNYFLVFDIENQIQTILQKHEATKEKFKPRTNLHPLQEGYCYKKLGLGKNDLSITWNTDGVPVFHSSNFNIWPLLYVLNELEYSGQKDVQLAALWFGNGKPDMNTFLKPFVDQINKLSSEGFKYKRAGANKEKLIKVFPGPLTCDSVARCTLQNLNQFNGAYGCNWCLNQGEMVLRGDGHTRIYEAGEFEKRDEAQMKRNAKTAIQIKKPVNGVKGFSILMLLNYFNVVNGFVVDYMHSVCQGVVKATSCMWFDSSSYQREYYLGRKIDEIDSIFLSLKPIDEITRTPRTIKDRKQWHANEWRSWLLFYSPVILKNYLPDIYFKHWINLVLSVKILLSAKVSPEMILEAANYLRIFVQQYSGLYGNDTMTFNVHLLLHLHETATNWGPLWAVSCFQFENMNGKLMKLFNGTQKVPHQIAEKFAILSHISVISDKAFSTSASDIQDYFFDLLRGYPLLKRICIVNDLSFAHGLPRECVITSAVKLAFQPYLGNGNISNLKTAREFTKITTFGRTICSHEVAKRCNCGIKLKNGSFGIVQGLYRLKDGICNCLSINCSCSFNFFAIVKELRIYHQSQMNNQISSKCKFTNKILAYPVSDIKEKVLVLGTNTPKFAGYIYVIEMPNFYECD